MGPQEINLYEENSMFESKDLLTVAETAEYLRVCDRTVYKLIKEKKLFAIEVGKKLLVPKSMILVSLKINYLYFYYLQNTIYALFLRLPNQRVAH